MKLKKLLTIACGVTIALSACTKDKSTASNVVKDADGNVYKTVTIGTQTWMVENLKTTKYNDGTVIPNVTDSIAWSNLTTGAQCDYENNASNTKTYGKLYNWYAVNTGKLAPQGWHVPSEDEWKTLSTFLGGDDISGGALKEIGTIHWFLSNTDVTNSSGFTALPGGYRGNDGLFGCIGHFGYWWGSTQINTSTAYCRFLSRGNSLLFATNYVIKFGGSSVRCLKD